MGRLRSMVDLVRVGMVGKIIADLGRLALNTNTTFKNTPLMLVIRR